MKAWAVEPRPFDPETLTAYPLPCGCDGEKEAERKRNEDEADLMEQARLNFRASLLHHAGLVGRLSGCTFDSFQRRSDWRGAFGLSIKARQYWNAIYSDQCGNKPWLVMHGKYGTGKTHLAASIIHEAVLAGWKGVYFRSWTEYLGRLQASWDREQGEQRTNEIIDELKKGKLVVIDDIDKRESRSGWAKGELYTALNYRYNQMAPTVLTLNCALDDPALEKYMGRALIDRVIESAWLIVDFDGPSYRSKIKW